jgi:serine/threonine protein kinase
MKVIGDYVLIQPIGAGGFGQVFLAKSLKPNSAAGFYAIKVYSKANLNDNAFFDQIEKEYQIGKNLKHPNLVKSLDFILTDHEALLVQEYVGGISLRDLMNRLIRSQNRFGFSQIFEFALKFSEVLNYMHELKIPEVSIGFVHGDLQPSNIMFNKAGELKLIDYGLSGTNSLISKETVQSEYASISYIGKRRLQTGRIAHSDDLIAFGIILWEFCTGKNYYAFNDRKSIISEILRGQWRLANQVDPRVTPELSQFLFKLMNSDALDGYKNFRDLRAPLHDFHKSHRSSGDLSFAQVLTTLCKEEYESVKAKEIKAQKEFQVWQMNRPKESSLEKFFSGFFKK